MGASCEKSNASTGSSKTATYLIGYKNCSRKPGFINYSDVFLYISSTPSENLPDTHPVYIPFNRQNYIAELYCRIIVLKFIDEIKCLFELVRKYLWNSN